MGEGNTKCDRPANRRDFLKTSALAGAGLVMAGSAARAAETKPKGDKVRLACIGAGGMGHSDVHNLHAAGAEIVALCDVNEASARASFNRFPHAKRFKDFRKMFARYADEFDAVSVSTPDHTHAVATMMAMKHGKHVYTQKPLTHDVYEARKLTEAAKALGVCTQMGNQGTALPGLREAVEVIWSGAIGKPREVHVWTNRPVWPQGSNAILRHKMVETAMGGIDQCYCIPPTLDWDLWLGTAPARPYDPCYAPFNWRGWWDYGTGALGDMACHTANMAFMACKLGYPTSVEAMSSELNDQTFPMWSVIKYEFPAREDLPPLEWTWYDGGRDKPQWVLDKLKELAHGRDVPGSGSLIIGDKGTLYSPNDYGAEYMLLPEKDFEGYKPPAPTLPRAEHGHYAEWLEAIKLGKPEHAMSNFSYAGPLTETVVLGCVAMKAGQRIEWDGPNMRITNIPEANQYLRREYRAGWSL